MRASRAITSTSCYGTVSLLAGIDLLTGQVHALVKDRHRSCEFIELLKLKCPKTRLKPHFRHLLTRSLT
jgi:hypothetical protein